MSKLPDTIESIVDDLNDLKDPILASAVNTAPLVHTAHRNRAGLPQF